MTDDVGDTVALYRCKSCGDEFEGDAHGNHTGYECFACGGSIRKIRELSDEEVC